MCQNIQLKRLPKINNTRQTIQKLKMHILRTFAKKIFSEILYCRKLLKFVSQTLNTEHIHIIFDELKYDVLIFICRG